jgi:hypothetical protein
MSSGTFLIVLTAGAGLLAMWVHVRFPALAPERIGRTVAHVAAAFVLLHVAASSGNSMTAFAMVLFLLLPALVYALLCMIWMLQHAQTALGLGR